MINAIQRRHFIKGLGALAATLPFQGRSQSRDDIPAKRPNILILQPDQHSYHVMGAAGNRQALTPHLDRFAQESAFFENAVATSPVCCPWRASMQSGLYWHSHGVRKNNVRLNPELRCFAEHLVDVGYETGYIGKWHLDGGIPEQQPGGFIPPGPRRQGWKEWYGYQKSHEYFEVWRYNDKAKQVRIPNYEWEPTWHTDMAIDFIKRKESSNTPWCYYVAYGPPHKPNQCKQEFLDLYDPASFELTPAQKARYPDEAELRRELQMYYGQVSAVDHEVGRMLTALDSMGIAENTIILYVSDHGDVLGSDGRLRGKSVPYSTAFRVPTMIRWKGVTQAGRNQALIGAPDLPATLLELAGLKPPTDWQGQSFAPLCRGEKQKTREQILLGLDNWTGVWDGRYLYSEGDPHCLYDHQEDPFELENLIGNSRLRSMMQEKLNDAKMASGWKS